MREKYGTLTMHDFPQWTKDSYPGVYHMDLWSDVFGDPDDADQFVETKFERDGETPHLLQVGPDQTCFCEMAGRIGQHHG